LSLLETNFTVRTIISPVSLSMRVLTRRPPAECSGEPPMRHCCRSIPVSAYERDKSFIGVKSPCRKRGAMASTGVAGKGKKPREKAAAAEGVKSFRQAVAEIHAIRPPLTQNPHA